MFGMIMPGVEFNDHKRCCWCCGRAHRHKARTAMVAGARGYLP